MTVMDRICFACKAMNMNCYPNQPLTEKHMHNCWSNRQRHDNKCWQMKTEVKISVNIADNAAACEVNHFSGLSSCSYQQEPSTLTVSFMPKSAQ